MLGREAGCSLAVCGMFSQIVRVQSKNGTKRIQAEPSHTLQRFLEKVRVSCGVRGPSLALVSLFRLSQSSSCAPPTPSPSTARPA